MEKTYENHNVNGTKNFKGTGIPSGTPAFTLSNEVAENMKSNGSLMRAFPLVFLGDDFIDAMKEDVWMTNPSNVNLHCEYIFLTSLNMALKLHPATKIWDTALEASNGAPDDVKKVFFDILNSKERAIEGKPYKDAPFDVKGSVYTSFYCAMCCLYKRVDEEKGIFDNNVSFCKTTGKKKTKKGISGIVDDMKSLSVCCEDSPFTYADYMKFVIELGGDTDTNAAIAGALVGAIVGYTEMVSDNTTLENIGIMINSTSSGSQYERHPQFQILDINELCESWYNLSTY
jgi:hypothetical protein